MNGYNDDDDDDEYIPCVADYNLSYATLCRSSKLKTKIVYI